MDGLGDESTAVPFRQKVRPPLFGLLFHRSLESRVVYD